MRKSRLPSRLFVFLLLALRLPFQLLRRKPQHIARILVLHHLRLGDTFMLAPLLAKLREAYPQAQICLTVPRSFIPLYAKRPWDVEAVPYEPRELGTVLRLFRRPTFDLVLLPADNRYSLLARALGAKWISAFADDKRSWKNYLVDELHATPTVPTAWGDAMAELLDGPAPAPYAPGQWRKPPSAAFESPGKPYALLHIGASSKLKLWPAERWQSLAMQLHHAGLRVVWSAGADETALIRAADPKKLHMDLSGQLDLPQLWSVVAQAQILVCPDTGISHMAKLAGVPTVSLFGPGSALMCGKGDFWRDMPWRAVTTTAMPCRNQQKQFGRLIPWVARCTREYGQGEGHCAQPKCMETIEVADVMAAIRSLGVLAMQGERSWPARKIVPIKVI